MKSAFYYVLKRKLIEKGSDGKPVFIEKETVFENENPINAREEAFNSFQSYVDVLLQGLGSKYESDKQARSELKQHKSFVSIGICIVQTTEIDDLPLGGKDQEICIHAIGPIGLFNFDMEDISGRGGDESYKDALDYEFGLYEYFKYDMGAYKIEIQYYDDTEHDDSFPSVFDPYYILKTPFDWNEHSEQKRLKLEAEDALDKADEIEPETLEYSEEWFIEQIAKGESETTEFKPSLVYNYLTEAAGMGIKAIIAKAICAFLNTRGGVLFIGVKDNGEIQGLESDFSLSPKDKEPRDYFRLEFDQMITHFFGRSIYSNIIPTMLTIEDKSVFAVRVWSSKSPVFIKGREKDTKEFYIRGAASTLPLHETPEKLVEYCLNKWGTKE